MAARKPQFPGDLNVELVLNGDFATDTIWVKGVGWTIAGVGNCDGTQIAVTDLTQDPIAGLTAPGVYEVTYTLTRSAGTFTPIVGAIALTPRLVGGTFVEEITPVPGEQALILRGDSNFIGTVDNVSVQRISLL